MSSETPRNGGSRRNISAAVLRHRTLTLFFLIALTLGGILAYKQLGLKEEPEFKFKLMVIRVLWPGAGADEIERQVTDKIEKKLQETPHLDYLRSYSKPGESVIFVAVRGETQNFDVDVTWYTVRKKVSDIRSALPPGVAGPFFNDEFGDTYANIYALSGEGFSPADLKQYAERIRADLLRVDGVEKADLLGVQDERIYIEFSQRRLATLGVDPQQLFSALAEQNRMAAAGRVINDNNSLVVRVTGSFDSVNAIRNTAVRVRGATFRLGDIANVSRGYVDPPVSKMRHQGHDVVGLAISMRKGGDVTELGRRVDERVEALRRDLPLGLSLDTVADQPKMVRRSAGEFNRSLAEAVAIVLAVSFLSLGVRTGLVVALTIPIVLAITFLGMKLGGQELHRISFGALIIALGLLVDDAMIAVEMMSRKLEEGLDRLRAASHTYTTTAFPMLTGTLITVAGFMPIGLSRSVASEYTGSIFTVTAIALIVSWVAAITFTPYLGWLLLKPHRSERGAHELYDTPFYRRFRSTLDWCLEHRRKVIGATAALFALSIVGFSLVQKQFFPSSNRPEMVISLRLAEDASFGATEQAVKAVEKLLAADTDVAQFTSYVGQSTARFYLPLNQEEFSSGNYAELVAVAVDSRARDRVMNRLQSRLQEAIPAARTRVEKLPNGPPVGYPIQFRVSGADTSVLALHASKIAEVLRRHPHTREVNLDWFERQRAIRLVIDQEKARVLGVTSAQVRQTLAAALSGITLTEFREGDRTIEVVARTVAAERSLASAVSEVNIWTPAGKFVPISQLARMELGLEEARTWRHNRLPTITVRADVPDGIQPPDVTSQLLPLLEPIRAELPPGHYLDTGGSWYESKINEEPIQAVMPLMLLVIVTLLMLQLQSFSDTFLVLLTAPLGLIGVAAALLAFNAPMGFVAQLGVIALMGMIMRNSVILVDQIRQDMADGHPAWTAIRESTVRRFRPIMLTAAAAVLAMIPLTRSELWGPMAIAIMGGLLVATILTLLFLPALYAAWHRVRRDAPETG